jgi:hypothetical protein
MSSDRKVGVVALPSDRRYTSWMWNLDDLP